MRKIIILSIRFYIPFTLYVSKSMSIFLKFGFDAVPGIKLISPATGTMSFAPLKIRISLTNNCQPLGTPLNFGFSERLKCVLAIQIE